MKRDKLLKNLRGQGCVFLKHGGKHDWYMQPLTGEIDYVPRHRDINEQLAWKIIGNLARKRNK